MRLSYFGRSFFVYFTDPTGIPDNLAGTTRGSFIDISWNSLPDNDDVWRDVPPLRQYMINASLFFQPDQGHSSNTTVSPNFALEFAVSPFQLVAVQVAAMGRYLGNFSEPYCIFSSQYGKTIVRKGICTSNFQAYRSFRLFLY